VGKPRVQEGLRKLAKLGGEVWFKLDSATAEGMRQTNSVAVAPEKHLARLEMAATLCPTWIQSCFFERKGLPPSAVECDAYLRSVSQLATSESGVRGVLLYTVARPSHQPEAVEIAPSSDAWLEAFAGRIRALGLEVRVSGASSLERGGG
jgi:hypothetical protein